MNPVKPLIEDHPEVATGLCEMADALEAPDPEERQMFQAQNDFFVCQDDQVVGYCAFGKMDYHWFRDTHRKESRWVVAPVLEKVNIPELLVTKNPVSGKKAYLSTVIMDLNDEEGWTFKQIAAWLRREAMRLEQQAKQEGNNDGTNA